MSEPLVAVTLRCNGTDHDIEVRPDRLLADVIREELGFTGTKVGCGTGDCGACTVMLDGDAVCSCLVYAIECEGVAIETVEAVAERPSGRRVVESFVEQSAVQCGICTPGFVVSAAALVERTDGVPTRAEIEEALAGNLCRCTGYFPIIRAVQAAAERHAAQVA